MSTEQENILVEDLIAASRAGKLGVTDDRLRMLARYLVQHGWRKVEEPEYKSFMPRNDTVLHHTDITHDGVWRSL